MTSQRIKIFLLVAIVMQVSQTSSLLAQNWGDIKGLVTDAESNEVLPGVTIVVKGTQTGTASNAKGQYSFRVPARTWIIRYSYVGYEPVEKQVEIVRNRDTIVNVQLEPTALQLESVEIEGETVSEDLSTEFISSEQIQNVPTGIKDGYRNLKILPGVMTNSEMTNDYSVRGGGYNENQVLINGFEIYKPLRLTQGEQEGLGLVNPDMVKTMTFYTGGFPARYGGKLSSALDVEYKFPAASVPEGSASISLLDASAAAGMSLLNNRLSGNFGFRKAKPSKFFGTQQLKGDYNPDYTDFQAAVKWVPKEGQELQLLGLKAQHKFHLLPSTRKVNVGLLQSTQSIFNGIVDDSYGIDFIGLRSVNRLRSNLKAIHGISLFKIEEREDFDITSRSIATDVEFEIDPSIFPDGLSQKDFAANRISLHDLTLRGRYLLSSNSQLGELGWYFRSLGFSDTINEKTIIEGENYQGRQVRTVLDSLYDSAGLNAHQIGGYFQHNTELSETAGRFILTSGIRTDFFTFNNQWVFSPRISARYRRTENLTLSTSLGVYHQFPNYKELRGTREQGIPVGGSLNDQLKAQRSFELISGLRYFYPKHRFFFKAEAYYKRLGQLISYDLDNVRLDYSGVNDAKGYSYGFDLQIRGEMVPGLESWINYGFLVSRETFLDEYLNQFNQGVKRRPGDQRHTFSAFIQDYLPYDPSLKIYLRLLLGSGFPYSPFFNEAVDGEITTLVRGNRMSRNLPAYMRSDAGTTKSFSIKKRSENSRATSIHLTFEILNLFDVQNVVSYQWIVDVSGEYFRIPTRLTRRTVNFRAQIEF